MRRRSLLKGMAASAVAGMVGGPVDWAAGLAAGQGAPGWMTAKPGALGVSAATGRFRMNQVGFTPGGAKQIVVVLPSSGGLDGARPVVPIAFRVVAEGAGLGAEPVTAGHFTPAVVDAASGDTVLRAGLGAGLARLRQSGVYRLELDAAAPLFNRDGLGGATTVAVAVSEPFTVRSDAYADALRLTMRAFYGQRCGCAVDLGGGYRHAACHLDAAFHASSGRTGVVLNHGGWHDAGDYGRYVVNSGISTGTLLWAWELYQPVMERVRLGLPDAGATGAARLPDVLREIQWNLDWMLTLQDADGGVWHKQTSEQFCGFVMPEDDHLTSYVIGTGTAPYKSTGATADLASVAAIAARCYRAYDAAYADRCLAAARRAWSWAMAHPEVPFSNPPGIGTGGYGDAQLGDELLWASAELWRTTGEAQYGLAFVRGTGAGEIPGELALRAPSWGDVGPMAHWTYCLAQRAGRHGDAALAERIVAGTRKEAARLVAQGRANGYGNTLRLGEYGWGSNATAANQSLLLLIADRLERNPEAVEAAYGNLDYLLGRNCFGVSWVTQVGTRPFLQPHHRPSAADRIAAPWPGLLSGGPNAHPGDPTARTVAPGPPMRMWLDDARAYSMNEIAINWNAPLVFILAGLQG